MSKSARNSDPSNDPNDLKSKRALVARVARNLLVSKVVATRSVKGKNGDTFCGFSAAWQTSQEDHSGGLVDDEVPESQSVTGMTLKEAQVAAILLGRTVDLQAHRNAAAGGNISSDYCSRACAAISSNYAQLLAEVLGDAPAPEGEK